MFRLFKKKIITYLGRGGLKYFNGIDDFYIDTNNILDGKQLSIEIFWNDIKKKNDEEEVSDDEKRAIALTVKSHLEKDDILVTITPALLQ